MPVLRIGELEMFPPIIQGGMGVRVSRSGLASAVAKAGCGGVIATAGIGQFEKLHGKSAYDSNTVALRKEIRQVRSETDGVLGVNVMVALVEYETHIRTVTEEKVDMIISGAGLPLKMPAYCEDPHVMLIPIVSSVRTFALICKIWQKRYNKLPDAVVVEGPLAGGHLGYSYDDVVNGTSQTLEEIVKEVLHVANGFDKPIPVIAAGGVYTGDDIMKYIRMGASGVQMGTRFVCTDECDAHENFKQAYIDAKKDDIAIIKSPVGLPGRVIKNEFVERIMAGGTKPFVCAYHCLITCDPKAAPYCIANVLSNSSHGMLDEAFVFAGSNAYKCTKIIPVKELVDTIVEEMKQSIAAENMKVKTS